MNDTQNNNSYEDMMDEEEVVEFVPDTEETILKKSKSDAGDTISKLKEELAHAERERKEYLDLWQRAQADIVNSRRLNNEEKERAQKIAAKQIVEGLIPALDSFNSAFNNTTVWEKVDREWRLGIEYIYSQITKTLQENGLEIDNPKGAQFDPHKHEAMGTKPTNNKEEDHIIADVLQCGYTLNGVSIRPAKVVIFEYSIIS